ncbi:hypothetical protein FZEAL_116 [Fusarium zealandicum]|uniref:Uncharacterized protein n=1 Tax=Fusarium zealandicum TaxID=1053134 RepID=A0A8H4UVF6_9HYPO|nr:hypothetical protein FZEAL_116 [Fusarium zealandicum]
MKLSGHSFPSRRVLDFSRLHEDLPDEFYEIHFNTLFVEIYSLVERFFCPDGDAVASKTSPWLRKFPEEFIKYVELLARPDPHAGKWERILRDRTERSFLLQGIIFKVLDSGVFSHLLFGAGSEHGKMLQSTDAALVDAEGFRRSNLRAHTNRTYLEASRGDPSLFWDEVDKLCTQALALLKPAYTYAAEINTKEPSPIAQLHQSLHDVIAYAGWLNVCTRLSSAIVSYNWVIPGEPYSMSHVNLCQEAYTFSKEAAQRHQERLRTRRPNDVQQGSVARVKISVTPEIVRHKPVPESVASHGMTSYTIMKPHVVYYEGLELDAEEERAFMSLPDYIRRLRDRGSNPRLAALLIMVIGLICLWTSLTTTGQETWHNVQKWVQQIPGS